MNNFNHNNFYYINENNNHQNIKNKSSIINNRYNDLDNINIINKDEDIEDIINIYNNNMTNNYNNKSANENIIFNKNDENELIEKIQKLKEKLKQEKEKVNNNENTINILTKLQKQNIQKNINLSLDFNKVENEIKFKYKKNEEEIMDTQIKREKIYENNIHEINKEINIIENENREINREINNIKYKNKYLETKFNVIKGNLNKELIQKISEFEKLSEKMELLQKGIINKEEFYEKKIKELNSKYIQLKEINNNKDNVKARNNKKIFNTKKFFKTYNNFNSKWKNDNNNINDILYLREQIQILQNKAFKLTRILSLKLEENEVLSNEKSNLKQKIENNKNKSKNIENNNENKIIEIKKIINNYKNEISKMKLDLDNKNVEHKLKINEIIISYEKKLKILIENLNNLKKLKNDCFQISGDL